MKFKLFFFFFKKTNFPLSYYLIVYYYKKSVNKDIFICEIFIITGRVNYIHTSFITYTHTHAHTPFKVFLHNALKMTYNKLLSEVTEDRRLFVQKVYNEMDNNAIANARGSSEDYFLQLVERNK